TVGLVVGSVGVRGHVEAVQRVRELCKAAGKRLYVISVGKVNVPKLSNFADIDVFVLLSCPFGIILDSSDFFRPVLSMFEAEIALNPSKKWFGDGKWCSDFTQFVNDTVGTHEDDGADVSLVTGRIRAMNLPDNGKTTKGGQVVPYDAGDYFKNSTWRGLDDGIHLDESTELEEGRLGTALGYDTEPARRMRQ
ncbi:2-(3-amino-3-carboxypropyl)histidine synthase subunit 2, partial [Trichostrongylus colubriformis]